MAVASIYQNTNTKKNFTFLYILIIIGLLAAIYFGIGFAKSYLDFGAKSGLSADLFYGEGGLYLNDELLGPFPFESSEIEPGQNSVSLKGSGVAYDITLDFLPNSEVVLKRDLGVSQVFSAGQNFWLDKSNSDTVLSVISEPSGVDVYIDGTKVGTTPYSSSNLTEGDYDLKLEKAGYESQSARIEINEGHKLNSSITLFPMPVPEKIELLEDATDLYDIYSSNLLVTSSLEDWVQAIIYWNQTRGINLSGVGVNKDLVFDYFLDSDGNLYTATGTKISADSIELIENREKGAYLRKDIDQAGLSDAARDTYLALGNEVVAGGSGKQATILATGLGWLRVRDQAGLNGVEITRVNVGESFAVLEETPGWVKIKISDTTEGWVSDTYVSITE